MRLMMNGLKTIPLYRANKAESEYVGTDIEYVYSHHIKAAVAPATDEYSIANYGERTQAMYTLTVAVGEDVKHGDCVDIDGNCCKIVGDLKYTAHRTLTAERTGPVWKSKSET